MKRDFNGDGLTDILWRGADGSLAVWNCDASGLGAGLWGVLPIDAGLTLRGAGDTTHNGATDLVFQAGDGLVSTWSLGQPGSVIKTDLLSQSRSEVRGVGDFDGNGYADLLHYSPPASPFGGDAGTWTATSGLDRKVPPVGLGDFPKTSLDYKFVGTGDFDGDGKDSLLFRGTGGSGARNFLSEEIGGDVQIFAAPGPEWQVKALADFNGDGKSDILWQHSTGAPAVWLMDGKNWVGGGMVYNPGPEWSLAAVQDYNNDSKADLMWHHASGWNCEWLMNGNEIQSFGASIYMPNDFWTVVG